MSPTHYGMMTSIIQEMTDLIVSTMAAKLIKIVKLQNSFDLSESRDSN